MLLRRMRFIDQPCASQTEALEDHMFSDSFCSFLYVLKFLIVVDDSGMPLVSQSLFYLAFKLVSILKISDVVSYSYKLLQVVLSVFIVLLFCFVMNKAKKQKPHRPCSPSFFRPPFLR